MKPVLAGMAAIPRREDLLRRTLDTLEPQVDEIRIWLNGFESVPQWLHERQRCSWVLSRENLGAEKKLHWAPEWSGYYFSVDDDIIYPPDYVRTMVEAIDRWDGRALVTCHGRAYKPRASRVQDVEPASIGLFHRRIDCPRWVNHGGTGVMAWDASVVQVPRYWPHRNILDMQVAVWAQGAQVPIWLIAHQAHWLKSPAIHDPRGIYKSSQLERHERRNGLLKKCRWTLLSLD